MIALTDEALNIIVEKFDTKNQNKDYDNAKALIDSDEINDVLDFFSTLILVDGMDWVKGGEITDLGRKYERMYDDIFDNN